MQFCNFQCARTLFYFRVKGWTVGEKKNLDPIWNRDLLEVATFSNLFSLFLSESWGGWVLEPIPAAYRQRQGTPLNVSPSHCRALCELVSVPCSMVPRRWSESVFVPPEHFYVLSALRLEARTLWFSAPTDWASNLLLSNFGYYCLLWTIPL